MCVNGHHMTAAAVRASGARHMMNVTQTGGGKLAGTQEVKDYYRRYLRGRKLKAPSCLIGDGRLVSRDLELTGDPLFGRGGRRSDTMS